MRECIFFFFLTALHKGLLQLEGQCPEIENWTHGLDMMPTGKNWNQPKFKGTWHCETILLGVSTLSITLDNAKELLKVRLYRILKLLENEQVSRRAACFGMKPAVVAR